MTTARFFQQLSSKFQSDLMKQPLHRPKILFVHNGSTRFVARDCYLLSQQYDVTEMFVQKRLSSFSGMWKAVHKADLVFFWFASWHSVIPTLLARVMRKPVIAAVGGYDTANLPHIGYGSQRGGLRRVISRTVLFNATALIVPSKYAKQEVTQTIGVPEERVTVIYIGFDIPPYISGVRERLVMTTGNLWEENLQRKGILPFVQAAKFLPDVKFVHVGRWFDSSIDKLRAVATENVTFTGYLTDDELDELYMKAAVYVQPSLHESFGMSVAEAMLKSCIPVVNRAGALPEVVGNTGIIIENPEPQTVAEGITQALTFNEEAGSLAYQHVTSNFPIHMRKTKLVQAINQLLK